MRIVHRAAAATAVLCIIYMGPAQAKDLPKKPPAAGAPGAAGSADAPRPTEGSLWTMDGKRVIDVPLKHTEVHIRVAGYVADVEVTQTFQNPYDRKIEAVYAYPLPTGAAVDRLTLRTGGEVIEGSLHRRGDAKAIYKAAKDSGRVAALLEEERANLFTQSVANIEPGAEITVAIHYAQELPYEAGRYELVFPMVASPRYIPATSPGAAPAVPAAPAAGPGSHPDTVAVPDASRVTPLYLPPDTRSSHDIALTIDIDAGVPVHAIRSTSHSIVTSAATATGAHIVLAPGDTIPNKDFVLRYDVAGTAPAVALLSHRGPGDEKGTFFLMVEPPASAADADVAPRELVFVVDTSSSMAGAPLAKAKEVIRASLRAMLPADTFQIVRFGDKASALGVAPIANKPKNVELALSWLDGLEATGGTEMIAGMRAALDFAHDPGRLRIVLFLTDGYVGNEDEVLAAVHERLGASRLFSFGVGTAVNRYLLEEMASFGRGAVEVARPDEDTTAAVARFHARIARPVLTDVSVDWKGLAVADVVPSAIPDLFLGQPLVLHGRYAAAGKATIEVKGILGGREVAIPVEVSLPERDETHRAVGAVWAKARIKELSRALVRKDDPLVVEEATATALQHGLLSRWTAFVAVSTKVTAGGLAETVAVPLEAPEGLAPAARPPAGISTPMGKSVSGDDHVAYDMPWAGDGMFHGGGGGGGALATGAPKPEDGPSLRDEVVAAGPPPGPPPHVGVKPGPAADEDLRVEAERKAAKETASRAKAVYASSLRGCYEGAVARGVPVGKKLGLEVTVADSGKVEAAHIAGAKDAALESCVGSVAKAWTFAKARHVAAFDVGF